MKRDAVLMALKEYAERSRERYGILKLGVFGSMAGGQEDALSDLDIVVSLRDQDLFNLIGIKQDIEALLRIHVDVVSYRPMMNAFLKSRIDREAIYVEAV